jgi:hypothetical protein
MRDHDHECNRLWVAMKRLGVAFVACALAWVPLYVAPAGAQDEASDAGNANLVFDYYEPRDPAFLPLYQKLQKRELLEDLGQFLAPIKWPKKLRLIMKECSPARNDPPEMSELVFYNGTEYTLNVCYQLFAFLEKLQPPATLATPQQAVIGGLVDGVLHEAGRAMFDMLQIPVLGSEEDAADQMAGFLALQFGDEAAGTVIRGSYAVWDSYRTAAQSKMKPYEEAGKASLAPQRAYNLLCIAFGRDQAAFQDLVKVSELPATRAANCTDEYRQVANAFQATVIDKGYVDMDRMQKITSMTWIMPGDLLNLP